MTSASRKIIKINGEEVISTEVISKSFIKREFGIENENQLLIQQIGQVSVDQNQVYLFKSDKEVYVYDLSNLKNGLDQNVELRSLPLEHDDSVISGFIHDNIQIVERLSNQTKSLEMLLEKHLIVTQQSVREALSHWGLTGKIMNKLQDIKFLDTSILSYLEPSEAYQAAISENLEYSLKYSEALEKVDNSIRTVQQFIFDRKKKKEETTEFRDRLKSSSNQKEKVLKLFSDVKKAAEKVEREQSNTVEVVQRVNEIVASIQNINSWCEKNPIKEINKTLTEFISQYGFYLIHQYHLSLYQKEASKILGNMINDSLEIHQQESIRLKYVREKIEKFPLKYTHDIPLFKVELVNTTNITNHEILHHHIKTYLTHVGEINKELKKNMESLLHNLAPSPIQFQIFFANSDFKKLLQSEIKKKEETVNAPKSDEHPRVRELEEKLGKIYEEYRTMKIAYERSLEEEWENVSEHQDNEALQQEITSLKINLETLTELKNNLEKQEKDLKSKIGDLSTMLEEEKVKNQKLSEYYNQEEEKKNQIANQITIYKETIDKLEADVISKKNQIEELEKEMKFKLEDSVIIREGEIKNFQKEIEAKDENIKALRNSIDQLTSKLKEMEDQSSTKEEEIKKVRAEVESKDKLIENDYKPKLSNFEKELNSKTEKIKELESLVKQIKDEKINDIGHLSGDIRALESKIKEKEELLEQEIKKSADRAVEGMNHLHEKEKLEKEVENLNKLIESLKQEKSTNHSLIEELQNKVAKLESDNSNSETIIDQLRKTIQKLEYEKQSLESSLGDEKEKVSNATEKLNVATLEKESVQEFANSMKEKAISYEVTINSLKEQIQSIGNPESKHNICIGEPKINDTCLFIRSRQNFILFHKNFKKTSYHLDTEYFHDKISEFKNSDWLVGTVIYMSEDDGTHNPRNVSCQLIEHGSMDPVWKFK